MVHFNITFFLSNYPEDELECRDSIFIQSLDDVAVPHALLEGRPTAGDDCFVLDLHFNQGESVV